MNRPWTQCLALTIVIALSLGGLSYAKARPDGSPLSASHAKGPLAAEINSSDVSRARGSGIAGDVTSSPNSGSSTISKTHGMKGTIAVTTVGRNSVKAKVAGLGYLARPSIATPAATDRIEPTRAGSSAEVLRESSSPPASDWWDCMGDCLSSAGVSPMSIAGCAGACATTIIGCAICVGVGVTLVGLCGVLCLAYAH